MKNKILILIKKIGALQSENSESRKELDEQITELLKKNKELHNENSDLKQKSNKEICKLKNKLNVQKNDFEKILAEQGKVSSNLENKNSELRTKLNDLNIQISKIAVIENLKIYGHGIGLCSDFNLPEKIQIPYTYCFPKKDFYFFTMKYNGTEVVMPLASTIAVKRTNGVLSNFQIIFQMEIDSCKVMRFDSTYYHTSTFVDLNNFKSLESLQKSFNTINGMVTYSKNKPNLRSLYNKALEYRRKTQEQINNLK